MANKKAIFLIGTSGWSFSHWRGKFYPKNIPQKRWLTFYANEFPVVELNATAYRFFNDQNYIDWRLQVPEHFRFVVKVHRTITHRKYLKDCEADIQKFCQKVALLNNKLGLILLQLPPKMPYDPERLKRALLAFDEPKKVVVEFRHPQWLTEETKQLLTDLGCIFCATDSPVSNLTDWLTSKYAYIRLHGHKSWYESNYSKKELEKIAKFAKELTQKGAKQVYIFFNNDYQGYAVKNAKQLKKILSVQAF